MDDVRESTPDTTVAVIGGGPVGVMTGLMLARRGVDVIVFEREHDVYPLPRAVGMDAEIQRIFQQLGLSEQLRELTTPIAGGEFIDATGERIIGNDVPVDGPFPLGHHPSVMYHQPWIEQFLRDEATAAGVDIRLGLEVDDFTDHGDHVELTTDGGATVTASWVIACDGASSRTRKRLGIGFEDQGFDQSWLVFDVEVHEGVDHLPRHAQQKCDPQRPVTFVPGHDRFRRWELQLQDGESAEEMTRPDRVWELIDGWIDPSQGTLGRAVVYRFHATVAAEFRAGRVFLAGDAAHQMPPFLGQGLCSGWRDSANLAWKIDLVERGVADDRLLDTYVVERRPHAKATVAHAVATGRLIDQLSGRGDGDVGMENAYGGGRELPYLRDGVLVDGGSGVGKPFPQPTVDGALFDSALGDGWAVVVHDDSALSTDVHALVGRLEARLVKSPEVLVGRTVPHGGAVVVRPDRYIAATVDDGAELVDVISRLLDMAGMSDGA